MINKELKVSLKHVAGNGLGKVTHVQFVGGRTRDLLLDTIGGYKTLVIHGEEELENFLDEMAAKRDEYYAAKAKAEEVKSDRAQAVEDVKAKESAILDKGKLGGDAGRVESEASEPETSDAEEEAEEPQQNDLGF